MNIIKWFNGIRVYLAIAIAVVTLEAWWWTQTVYAGSNLATIRLQEIYAWLAVILLVAAVAVGPFTKLYPNFSGIGLLRDARRMIGVGAAWFASLHVIISYAALFQFANPLSLSDTYQQAFLGGVIALLILLAMAFTSFDAAFRKLGIWWLRLHRLVYAAVLLAFLHAFQIGTHAATVPALIIVTMAAIVLLGMHVYLLFKKGQPSHWQIITVTCMLIFVAAVLNYGLSQYQGYNIFLPDGGAH